MRAWRTHPYGPPLAALRLDDVPIPAPGPGELFERITVGNMMVRHELPYGPGMEVMGVVEDAGAGADAFRGMRVVALTKGAIGGDAEYALCPIASACSIARTCEPARAC